MATTKPKPRRRVELRIRIHADSWDDLQGAVAQIQEIMAHEVKQGGINSGVGGPHASWSMIGDVDPYWTHDRYADALLAHERERTR